MRYLTFTASEVVLIRVSVIGLAVCPETGALLIPATEALLQL